jgi:hypothetical protein
MLLACERPHADDSGAPSRHAPSTVRERRIFDPLRLGPDEIVQTTSRAVDQRGAP